MGKELTAEQVIELKELLKKELARRNGVDSVAKYAGPEYDFLQQPQEGRPITKDQGEKIIDLVLKIANFGDLLETSYYRGIPKEFNTDLLDFVRKLSKCESTGETEATTSLKGREHLKPEQSSCRATCTGLCIGSCVNHCNGCTSCTASCGGECSHSCKGQCRTTCTGSNGSLDIVRKRLIKEEETEQLKGGTLGELDGLLIKNKKQ